jgi:3-oxoacyl-[acyl-carrier protein] reductase
LFHSACGIVVSVPLTLDGKVALVTGAGSGIGRATVRAFAAAGARVVAADLDAGSAAETCEGIEATAVTADVRDPDDDARMVRAALDAYGGLDVFHNNAGIPESVKPLAEITREEWDRVIAVNLTAFFIAAQAVVPRMRERGGGSILVTASIIARRPRSGLAAYIAAKTGVTGLARALALELAPDRIRVNVINPGPARTPMLGAFGLGADDDAIGEGLPLGRLVEPGDIAAAAVYLASDAAAAVTGAVLNVDAGRDLS